MLASAFARNRLRVKLGTSIFRVNRAKSCDVCSYVLRGVCLCSLCELSLVLFENASFLDRLHLVHSFILLP
jgi:hypothetical protein